MEVGALSLSLFEVNDITECRVGTTQEVVKIVLECKKDMWSNIEMFNLSNEFFENSIKTLDLCTALENCLRRARSSQLIIKLAVKQFEEDENKDENERCVRTLEELNKFNEAGNPFKPDFVELLQSLYKQHASTFGKLNIERRKLDKKSNSTNTWRRVTNLIFVAAFVAVVIFSIVAAVKSAPPLVIALAATQAIPLGPVGKWCNTIWNRYLKKIDKEKQLIISMQQPSLEVLNELGKIRELVTDFSNLFSLFANHGNRDMQLVIDEIKKNLQGFDATIERFSVRAGECSKRVAKERTSVLQKIIRHPAADNSTPRVD